MSICCLRKKLISGCGIKGDVHIDFSISHINQKTFKTRVFLKGQVHSKSSLISGIPGAISLMNFQKTTGALLLI